MKIGADEYFLAEKLILTQGQYFDDIEDIKALCGWSSTTSYSTISEATTSMMTESTTTVDDVTTSADITTQTTINTTTTERPVPGICFVPGFSPDREDCSKYHSCEQNEAGDLWDVVLSCPDGNVWCQASLTCESPDICPCSD